MSVARRLGRYELGRRIGSGGVADVFEATVHGAEGVAKPVVIKRLRPDLSDDAGLVAALADEAKLATTLAHGNLVAVLDFGVHEDDDGTRHPYIVLERVDGCSLQALLDDAQDRRTRIGLPEALFVVDEVAAALDYAHRRTDPAGRPAPVVHRDVKPSNVLVSREGVVKLTDFGIAKAAGRERDTLPGVVKGTPLFLAPEQAAGRPVDARADVYGLGRVLQCLVVGPPGGDTLDDDPRVDDELRAIVRRAIADDPSERLASIDALREALSDWCRAASLRPRRDGLVSRVRAHRGDAPARKPIALDAALRDVAPIHATHHAAVASRAPTTSAGRRGWRVAAVVVGAAAIGVVWWAWRDGAFAPERPAVATRPERVEPPQLPSPQPEPSPTPPARGFVPPPPPPAPSPSQEPAGDATATKPSPRAKGRLRVNVLPWAEVSLDGRDLGRTPVDVRIDAGNHRLELFNPDLAQRKTRRIDVAAGGELSIQTW